MDTGKKQHESNSGDSLGSFDILGKDSSKEAPPKQVMSPNKFRKMRVFKYDPAISPSDDDLAADPTPGALYPIRLPKPEGARTRGAPLIDRNAPDFIPWDEWRLGKYP